MAEPLAPAPIREALTFRDTLLLTAVWIRWLEDLRRQHSQMQAEIADLQARVTALEQAP